MITKITILLTVSIAMFQLVFRMYCMTIHQKRPFNKNLATEKEIISRNLRETITSEEEEAFATTDIDLYSRTEDATEFESKQNDSVFRDNGSFGTSPETDDGAQIVMNTIDKSVLDISIESASELLDVSTTTVEQEYLGKESAGAEPVENESSGIKSVGDEFSGSESLGIEPSITKPTRNESSETNFAGGEFSEKVPAENPTAGEESLQKETLGNEYSGIESTEKESTKNQPSVTEHRDTKFIGNEYSGRKSLGIQSFKTKPPKNESPGKGFTRKESSSKGSSRTEYTGKEFAENESTGARYSGTESLPKHLHPSIVEETRQGVAVEITETPTSVTPEVITETIFNVVVEPKRNTDRENLSSSTTASQEELVPADKPIEKKFEIPKNPDILIRGDLIHPGFSDYDPEETTIVETTYGDGSSSGENVIRPSVEDLPTKPKLATKEVTRVTPHRIKIPYGQKESNSEAKNTVPSVVDEMMPLNTPTNAIPPSLPKNEFSSRIAKGRSTPEISNKSVTEVPPDQVEGNMKKSTLASENQMQKSNIEGSGPSADNLTKDEEDDILYRNISPMTLAKKCLKNNISCIDCTNISPYCHYSHSEAKCRYASVRHGNEIYECNARVIHADGFGPFMMTLGVVSVPTAAMLGFMVFVFYRRCIRKEPIPKEQTEEMRERLNLIRQKRLK